MKKYKVAVVGATGLVGSTFLKLLWEYKFPIEELTLFASERSAGKKVAFGDSEYTVQKLEKGCFDGIEIALFSAGGSVSLEWAPEAEKSGAVVIDNSSAWRMVQECALIVPEINLDHFDTARKIVANPNCSTIQSVLPLKPLEENFGLKRVVYTTYQAVSGSGMKGKNDLARTLAGEKPEFYPYNISETCIPQIDVFTDNGYTKEELKMVNETRKILGKPDLKVSATCVRVPVQNAHAVSVMVELEKPFTLEEVRKAFESQEGIKVLDDPQNSIYPVSTVANGNDLVYVGRIRRDLSTDNGLLFYCVSDNIRKGAAANAIQIAKALIKENKI
ncbi:MAG: aspartate-semialdehyde dehydrogenase [Clostridiales bacterium]|jgi:aspartate-semialdehyde dehydrogenase|nr:aspartate-semialdehyde dehydrogenase [Clostridiales bacterium]